MYLTWQLLCGSDAYELFAANWSGRPVFTGQRRNFYTADEPGNRRRVKLAHALLDLRLMNAAVLSSPTSLVLTVGCFRQLDRCMAAR